METSIGRVGGVAGIDELARSYDAMRDPDRGGGGLRLLQLTRSQTVAHARHR